MGIATLNRTVNRLNFAMSGLGSGGSGAALVKGLGPAAWFRFGQGITVTGAGVSTWADQSGNGRDLLQGTDTNRPALQADGSILFDGVDNFLKCNAFTLNQPITVYMLVNQISWTSADQFFDGETAVSVMLRQVNGGASPDLEYFAGVGPVGPVTTLPVGVYGAVSTVFNGAASSCQVNFTTSVDGNAGTQAMGGFTLAARPTPANFANIQVKEVILYNAAHAAPIRNRVIRYLSRVGQLGV